ncbi:trypsin-like peptidase domain-containing protein [Streptomyces sp. NPDC051315]|uniref:S1C family serine protease n=1 Tax=Streptomyces sp. NPDC051315 TaxID=3365650 RepID=UPI0037B0C019
MNEGKPTKGKWWSRPRPQGTAGPESGPDTGRESSEGDFELARPAGAAAEEHTGRPAGTPDDGRDDGDYALSRPVSATVAPATAGAAGTAGGAPATAGAAAEESVEQRPAAVAGPVSVPGSQAGSVEAVSAGEPGAGLVEPVSAGEPQVEALQPVSEQGPYVESAQPARAQEPYGEPVQPAPAQESQAESPQPAPARDPHAESPQPVPSDGAAGPAASAAPVSPSSATGDRPRPLHDPDPYSTPPYGEPGPWAPAPPVQHPAVRPARNTAPGTPAPGMADPVPALQAPAPGMPDAVPAISTPAPTMAAPAPVTHASTTSAPAPDSPLPPSPSVGAGEVPAAAAPPVLPASPAAPWHRYDPWSAAPLQQTGAAVPTERQRRRRVRATLVAGALTLALVSGALGGAVGVYLERNGGFDGVELPQASAEPTGRAADSVSGIAARALPSVVTLHVSGSEESGTGTGFVLDARGHILTNNHVVEPAGSDGEITVVFNGGQTAEAEIVGGDSGYDLAVVKVTGVKGLKPLNLGNSDNVQVGDPVVAIGAPFDLEGTVTSGIISAKERPITAGGESGDGSDVSYVDALQTDAPINPGNSGGPLLDARGRVIGVNSAIRSAADAADSEGGQAGSIGLGFAIPINQGKRVAEELINTGRATHPVIGVTLDMDYAGDGARVGTQSGDGGSPVTPGGPGDRAGIRAGDVITEVDGRRVHSGEELIVKTRAHRPGDRLELTIERDGEELSLSLVLGSSD